MSLHYEVPNPNSTCPGQLRRFLEALYRHTGLNLMGRPTFERGLVVGKGPDAVHVTPERLRLALEYVESILAEEPGPALPEDHAAASPVSAVGLRSGKPRVKGAQSWKLLDI